MANRFFLAFALLMAVWCRAGSLFDEPGSPGHPTKSSRLREARRKFEGAIATAQQRYSKATADAAQAYVTKLETLADSAKAAGRDEEAAWARAEAAAVQDKQRIATNPPKSLAAAAARAAFEHAMEDGKRDFLADAGAARAAYLTELEAARQIALAGTDAAESAQIAAEIERVKQAPPDGTAATPSSPAGITGMLSYDFKGEMSDVFLNGKPVAHGDKNSRLVQERLTLAEGDVLTFRLISRFVYRSVRFVFTDDAGRVRLASHRDQTWLLPAPPDGTPPRPARQKPSTAQSPPGGKPDPGQEKVWQNAHLPDEGEWIRLPEKSRWYDLTVVVREEK